MVALHCPPLPPTDWWLNPAATLPAACCLPPPLPLSFPCPADVRSAAADALAQGADLHPEVLPDALTATVAMYSEQGGSLAARAGELPAALPLIPLHCCAAALPYCCAAALLCWQFTGQCVPGPGGAVCGVWGRASLLLTCSSLPHAPSLGPLLLLLLLPPAGSAAALRALAPFLSADQLPAALDFLLSCGLTDTNTTIREAMIAAGGWVDLGMLLPCSTIRI